MPSFVSQVSQATITVMLCFIRDLIACSKSLNLQQHLFVYSFERFYSVRCNLVKGVQCYELLGGIALKIHTFSFHFFI